MKLKYPKLIGFVLSIILAYIIFSNAYVSSVIHNLGKLGYAGSFIAGMFYTFGFTSPLSSGFFIDLNPTSIFLAGILGGLGALIGDMFIFSFARKYFKDEFKYLGKEKIFKKIRFKLNCFVIYMIAAILIASPLPDEAGITLLAGFTKIRVKTIAIVSIIFNTIGILILLSI
jgi:uncharacterized membrane protein YdjX (TVP38/TMEM64 family)